MIQTDQSGELSLLAIPDRVILRPRETAKFGSHGYRDRFEMESTDGSRTWKKPNGILPAKLIWSEPNRAFSSHRR